MTSNDYQFWLTANGEKEKMQLPVNPEKITVKRNSNNDRVNIAGLGEITIIKDRKAVEFSFSSFFPATYFPGAKVKKMTSPLTLVKKIESWQESKKPIHFVVTKCGIDIYCTIESFSYSEVGGDVGTYSYSITLKEYREITVRKITVDTSLRLAKFFGLSDGYFMSLQDDIDIRNAKMELAPQLEEIKTYAYA